jgi:hypothetical protein
MAVQARGQIITTSLRTDRRAGAHLARKVSPDFSKHPWRSYYEVFFGGYSYHSFYFSTVPGNGFKRIRIKECLIRIIREIG